MKFLGRCKHAWILRSAAKDIGLRLGQSLHVTRLLFICDKCGKVREQTVDGYHDLADLAALTDQELDKIRS